MALMYLLERRRSAEAAARLFRFYLWIGAAGFAAYLLFPAVSSMFLFPERFPHHPPPLAEVGIVQTPSSDAPRNCMPSLHTTWARAILWAALRHGRAVRWAMGGFSFLVILYTLCSAQHYAVDLVAALPFSVVVYAAAHGLLGEPRGRRLALLGAGCYATWLVGLRFGGPLWQATPAIPWLSTAATLVWGAAAIRRLRRLERRLVGQQGLSGARHQAQRLTQLVDV
jgi:hypothetical protein